MAFGFPGAPAGGPPEPGAPVGGSPATSIVNVALALLAGSTWGAN